MNHITTNIISDNIGPYCTQHDSRECMDIDQLPEYAWTKRPGEEFLTAIPLTEVVHANLED